MNIQEKKQHLLDAVLEKYKHLNTYCEISCIGLEDDSPFFHPKFTLDEDAYITSQGDVGSKDIYALRFVKDRLNIGISNDLFEHVVIGYHNNKETVMQSLKAMNRLRTHIGNLNECISTYISNSLIGASSEDITKDIINELRLTNALLNAVKK